MKNFLIGFAIAIAIMVGGYAFVSPKKSDIKKEYCELLGIEAGIVHNKVKISVDFGERSRQKLKDEAGKAIKFNSMIDAFNYMADEGWKIEQTYAITHGNQHVYHFLMSREYTD